MGMIFNAIGESILGSYGFKDMGKGFQGNWEKLAYYRVFHDYQVA